MNCYRLGTDIGDDAFHPIIFISYSSSSYVCFSIPLRVINKVR